MVQEGDVFDLAFVLLSLDHDLCLGLDLDLDLGLGLFPFRVHGHVLAHDPGRVGHDRVQEGWAERQPRLPERRTHHGHKSSSLQAYAAGEPVAAVAAAGVDDVGVADGAVSGVAGDVANGAEGGVERGGAAGVVNGVAGGVADGVAGGVAADVTGGVRAEKPTRVPPPSSVAD